MTDVFIIADNIFSPLGISSPENFARLKKPGSGVMKHDDATMSEQPFYASLFNKKDALLNDDAKNKFTKFERLLIASISDALQNNEAIARDKKTILIISSTKGNISLLESETHSKELNKRIALTTSAKLVADHFHFVNQPLVISNACISGVLAIITGMRLIQSGQYENAVIAGADVISKFVLSGFQSFQAISDGPCKPFDAARTGINLGEGAGTVILSSQKKYSQGIKISGGSVSNDANHISGPSRTGEPLYHAITKALKDAGLSPSAIDLISAHGTATVYNDEMEAKAITLAGMQSAPVNSLKGYYGHTLGAAGLIESIVSIHSMKEGLVLPTMGFEHMGVTSPVNICSSLYKTSLQNCLKTASGFGGCNAALIFSKQ
ncbi:MAG TPA: beta-ketoacyl synthase N-terminal-like domain-containing protein [Chitinophagaceae bacterium]|nr:beta-ketoacyl synthase N-terminal-like domain-containing protein [Chitinophagaceae bacterium]